MNFIEQQYIEIISFYKQKLKFIFPATVIFFMIVIIVSSVVISLNPALATRLLITGSSAISAGINPAGLLPAISENAFLGFILIVSGVIPFVFAPALFVLYNASIIGILFGSTNISTVTPVLIYASILPHGVFLIPAMLLASSCGIYLCKCMIRHILHKEHIESISKLILQLGRVYLFVIIPLMIIAACIQMFITPFIISLI